MKIISWNCREASSDDTTTTIKDMVRKHNPFMVFVLETRLPAACINTLKQNLKFDLAYGIDALGYSGGIWLLWESQRIQVDILPHDFLALHAIVKEHAWIDSSMQN